MDEEIDMGHEDCAVCERVREREAEQRAIEIAAKMDTRSFNRAMRVVESLRNGELYPGELEEGREEEE